MIVVWTQPNCSWCTKVCEYLADMKLEFRKIDITEPNSAHIKGVMLATGIDTVPQVWDDGVLVGGYENTTFWYDQFKNEEK